MSYRTFVRRNVESVKASSKARILSAAADVAREAGAGRLSLDAVAARAGVSKGGLLYNFPTKAALMRALVESFLDRFELELDAACGGDESGRLLDAYIRLSAAECEDARPGGSGVLAAIAEDPDFLKPIIAFKRRLLDRLEAEGGEKGSLLMIYLALEGMRSLKLFDSDLLTDDERSSAVDSMLALASQRKRGAAAN